MMDPVFVLQFMVAASRWSWSLISASGLAILHWLRWFCITVIPELWILYSQDFPRSYRAFPAGPTPLDPTPSEPLPPDLVRTRFWPDFGPIRTWNPPFRVRIGSKSGPNWVQIRSGGKEFGGGRVQRGRSGWEGSVAPPETLDPLFLSVSACPLCLFVGADEMNEGLHLMTSHGVPGISLDNHKQEGRIHLRVFSGLGPFASMWLHNAAAGRSEACCTAKGSCFRLRNDHVPIGKV